MHGKKVKVGIHKIADIIEIRRKNRHTRLYQVGTNSHCAGVADQQINGKSLNKYKKGGIDQKGSKTAFQTTVC